MTAGESGWAQHWLLHLAVLTWNDGFPSGTAGTLPGVACARGVKRGPRDCWSRFRALLTVAL
jgi:hypothetical protein